ncbi:MAG: glycosyltransferase family 2 protein [Coriobacteriia bacterium]|nr:glycosyltransferase family 2 protein [Coriobacteriia bacterium]
MTEDERHEDAPVRRTHYGWGRVALTNLVVVGLPTALYYRLRVLGHDLMWLHLFIAAVYLLTALVIIWEASVSITRKHASRDKRQGLLAFIQRLLGTTGGRLPAGDTPPVPRTTLIVAAFLPNEREIIVETITYLLNTIERPAAGLEVILAYNTPCDLPVEDRLSALAEHDTSFRPLCVADSESKAQNVDAALEIATGEIICILDADHHTCPDCLSRAWRWLANGYDVVQGRSVIRNHATNFLTRMIAVEFECIYAVSHSARSIGADTAIFGGSNGYWRASVLKEIRFDQTMMTEDIDASARALLAGYRIVHDRSIISTELAPTTFHSFWCQRKRWAQGWLQVSIRHQRAFWSSRRLSLVQKAHWTYLLLYRELYPLITLQIFPVVISLYLYQGSVPLRTHWFLWLSTIVTLLSGPFATVSAMKNAHIRYRWWYGLVYGLTVIGFVMLKNLIVLVAMYDQLFKRTDWVVTRRDISHQLQEQLASAE